MARGDQSAHEELVRAILVAATGVRGELRGALSNAGLTLEQWVVLDTLWSGDAASQQDLARLTGKDKSSVTRIVDGLVAKELVHRRDDPGDARRTQACLTERGAELRRTAGHAIQKSVASFTGHLDEATARGTARLLTHLASLIAFD